MTQWEYTQDVCQDVRPKETTPKLNARGRDGWELVTLSENAGFVILFWKRPLSATTGQRTEV